MKILVITDLYPILENEKHTPRTIYDFVKGWRALGNEISVIKPNFIFNSFVRKKPFYKSGIYNDVENINYWTPFWGNIKNKIKKEYKPDIVIAHMPSGLIFANKLGLPFVAGVHVSDIEVLTNPLYSIYFKQELENAYKKAIKIACRSEVLKNKFLNLYPQYKNKVFVAFSGINESIIVRRNWENTKRIFTCANLIKRKNIDKVIQACEKIPDIELIIAGDGEELKKLKKISKKPKFLGHIAHSEVIENMKKSDIFILPSQNETFGMVYLEAMASSCITIGLKNDGIDGIIIDGKNGYLTDLDNIQSTIEKALYSTNQNDIIKNAYNTILNYTIEKACQNYLDNII